MLPFSASIAFLASEDLAKATKAQPLLYPSWFIRTLMLVIYPYDENCLLMAPSSVLNDMFPTNSSFCPESSSSPSPSLSGLAFLAAGFLEALLFETLDCFLTAFFGSSSLSSSESDSSSLSSSFFAGAFFAGSAFLPPFGAITFTSSSDDDSSSLLSLAAFLAGTTFLAGTPLATGLTSSSESDESSLEAAFFWTVFCLSSFLAPFWVCPFLALADETTDDVLGLFCPTTVFFLASESESESSSDELSTTLPLPLAAGIFFPPLTIC